MSTVLYGSPIFGPVESRRLGVSLGVNLNPAAHKICSFDCIYCECGFNRNAIFPQTEEHTIPKRETVSKRLEETLQKMRSEGKFLDVITFAGNGEPTLHPDFSGVIDDTIRLRDEYYPKAHIAVLTNGTRVTDKGVLEALRRVDKPCVKIDSMDMKVVRELDRPTGSNYDVANVVKALVEGELNNLVIQTMFCRWQNESGVWVDNMGIKAIDLWIDMLRQVSPAELHIYTISR